MRYLTHPVNLISVVAAEESKIVRRGEEDNARADPYGVDPSVVVSVMNGSLIERRLIVSIHTLI